MYKWICGAYSSLIIYVVVVGSGGGGEGELDFTVKIKFWIICGFGITTYKQMVYVCYGMG